MCNAWIFLNEDEPQDTVYNSPTSCYQRMLNQGMYIANDIINLCFVDIVPTNADTIPAGDGSSYTLFLDKVTHPSDAKGPAPTNQDYMEWIVRDAKGTKPGHKGLPHVAFSASSTLISQIYPRPGAPGQSFGRGLW